MSASIVPPDCAPGRTADEAAGRRLDHALAAADIDRAGVYVTNAVKHFTSVPRGKRSLHQKPDRSEIVACKPWLQAERAELRPRVTMLLGATAAQAVLGRVVTTGRERGRPSPLDRGQGVVTVHPSYLLRLPDEAAKRREYAAFLADLRLAGSLRAA